MSALPPVDPTAFRRAMGRFATGVCVVTTREGELDHAMTVNAFTSVSLEPPLALVCVERDARFHDAVLAAGTWAVSILPVGARGHAQWLSTRGRPLHGQLSRVPHHRGPMTGAAILDPALAAVECRTTAVHPGGDHVIVLGEVLGVELPPEVPAPLLYHRARYTRMADTGTS